MSDWEDSGVARNPYHHDDDAVTDSKREYSPDSDDSESGDPFSTFPMFSSLTGQEVVKPDYDAQDDDSSEASIEIDEDLDIKQDYDTDMDYSDRENARASNAKAVERRNGVAHNRVEKPSDESQLEKPGQAADDSDADSSSEEPLVHQSRPAKKVPVPALFEIEDEALHTDNSANGSHEKSDEEDLAIPPVRRRESSEVAATPTPAPKRPAQGSNRASSKRQKIGTNRSAPLVDSDDDEPTTTPGVVGARQVHSSGRSSRSTSDVSRKQASKPTFTQTPLNFRAGSRSARRRRSNDNPTPSASQITPQLSRTGSAVSTPSTQTPSSALVRNFTEQERRAISDAVETFRVNNGMLPTEINALVQESLGAGQRRQSYGVTRKDKLWNAISAACPGRDRAKLLAYCRKNFHNYKARGGQWTQEEDDQLAQLVRSRGTKWSQISRILNRHPEDLRDRYRNYVVCADRRETEAWAEDEALRLSELVQEAVDDVESSREMEPDNRRFDRPVEHLINWQQISQQLGSRSRIQCLAKWRKMKAD